MRIMRHNLSGGKMKQRQCQFVVTLRTLTGRKRSLFSKKLFFKTPLIEGFFWSVEKHISHHLSYHQRRTLMTNPLYHKHIISINDLNRDDLESVLHVADKLKQHPNSQLLKDKVIASCFFEASTRTRLSFETAIHRLGASVVGFADGSNTSLGKKGETLADTISVLRTYADAIVIRHPQEGAARLASEFAGDIPVINAGDGANQHPSQTLLDLFTIKETQGRLDNLNIAMVGDLKYGRTVHSLAQALAKFTGNHLYFIAPKVLAMPEHILHLLEEHGVEYSQHETVDEVMSELDILYMTRVQKERLDPSEYANVKAQFILTSADLVNVKDNLKILHPLPRIDEITTDVDNTPYAYYFQQAGNGIYARQALLALVLNKNLVL